VTLGKVLPPGVFERKCESLRWRPGPPQSVVFADVIDDDATPPSFSPPSAVIPKKKIRRRQRGDEVGGTRMLVRDAAATDLDLVVDFSALSMGDTQSSLDVSI
jgi:hypothetical protein